MHVVKGRLEADGIECFVRDEHTVNANPFYDIAVGGIKLQVMEQDVAAANEILKEVNHTDTDTATTINTKSKSRQSTMLLVLIIVIVALLFLFMAISKNFFL